MSRNKNGKWFSKSHYKKLFSQCVDLDQYMKDRGIKLDSEVLGAFEIPVRLAYQLVSDESLYRHSGKTGGYVFPKVFLDAYMRRITCNKKAIKEFSDCYLFQSGLYDALKGALRVTVDDYNFECVTAANRVEGKALAESANEMLQTLKLPPYKLMLFGPKPGELDVDLEYPCYLLDSIDWIGKVKKLP